MQQVVGDGDGVEGFLQGVGFNLYTDYPLYCNSTHVDLTSLKKYQPGFERNVFGHVSSF